MEPAQQEDPERELEKRFEDVDFQEDILPEFRQLNTTHQEIGEAVSLSRSYVSEVLRGEKVPSLEHWEVFREVASEPG